MDWSLLIADGLVACKVLLAAVALAFLVSGLDDLFIDIVYAVRAVYRRLFITPHHAPLTEQTLREREEQWIAIMVPAWDESAVIRQMLLNMTAKLEYSNYHLFVGTYPNDPATIREVERVREANLRVHRISTPHDGPTNKADCLNWVYQGIRRCEQDEGLRFEIFVMQDCEDVIHPLCYKIFNHLMPRMDMIQLPVLSLERQWWKFTAGHYLDEFAQIHYKDLVVREVLDHSLPAAGVGCAFSRKAFECTASKQNNELFNTGSLTEDYDFGFRLKELGLRQVFVKFFTRRPALRRNPFTGRERVVEVRELVGVREYFPHTFRTAVRQKSRWVLGITLQGWANLGWLHGLSTRYMLWRDRKSLVTNLVNMLGYFIVLVVVSVWAWSALDPQGWHFPALVEEGSWLTGLLTTNAALLGFRVLQRGYCVQRLYGWRQALLSFPRAIWGNLINFMATARAIRIYANSLLTGKKIAWDKTQHQYPSEEQLRGSHRKLGDLLLESSMVSIDQLKDALAQQRSGPRRLLGLILRDMGVVREDQLLSVLQRQT